MYTSNLLCVKYVKIIILLYEFNLSYNHYHRLIQKFFISVLAELLLYYLLI
jgi:hypothetical protein